ncbi:DUF2878 domain-containing protein [Paraglaciecola sp. L3A3]|uniref:DUF2878 domain-containing protein n=1 Tax=Paraglaciecola sp. L3A3 TaxID=2686358 RepID=UPI00131D996D|nr:DUF2878 domain-containing protein [Paraglaciecola sp. L3A3]
MQKSWLINAVLFQLAWFSAALLTEFAVVLISLLLVLHFLLLDRKLVDAKLLMLAPIGWLLDSVLLHFSIISTSNDWIPLWLVILWCMFILSLNHSLLWLSKLAVHWQSLIGAIAGCSSYMAAISFGALQSSFPWLWQIVFFALSWAIVLPLLIMLRAKIIFRNIQTS